ncbi:MAG: ATP-dependent helicase, partial [Deltaproteobacteria bacterium]|nr:ATP-dependent helicase [Deltaproteobacteria bacterium]
GADPSQILLATFTNKAARSMLQRVRSQVDQNIDDLWGGTFHHIAHRILRKNSHYLGYDRNFSIIDSEDARQLINTGLAAKGLKERKGYFPQGNVLGEIISLAASTRQSIAQVIQRYFPSFLFCLDEITAMADWYREKKRFLNVMDFDDLLSNCVCLLSDFPDIHNAYAGRFKHVLVDEYQDTNLVQAELVDLLAHRYRNLMVVGDDSQSIYAFRGANHENIINFPIKYPDCKIFKLETNYRSTPQILNLANVSILNNKRQFPKELTAVKSSGIKPVLAPIKDALQQAAFACQRILELINSGIPLQEIAVLYRAHYHSLELQMELTRRRIPFEIRSGIRFFEQAHIKDVTAYIRIVANPFDELAWKRILGLYPKVGKVTAGKLWDFLSTQASPLSAVTTEAFLKRGTKSTRDGLVNLQNVLCRLVDGDSRKNPEELIAAIMDNGYRECLKERFADADSRQDDIEQLCRYSEGYTTLEAFLAELALMTNITEEPRGDFSDIPSNKIVLSTIHQAKGLEWSIVMVIMCADGMIPLARALRDRGGEEEERRLFYVAVTRAKDELYLCYPVYDYGRGMGSIPLSPSRFIREVSSNSREYKERPYDLWLIDES